MPNHSYRIAVIGLWQLGEIYSAGLASLGHNIIGIDDNKTVIKNFLKWRPPLEEPGLAALIRTGERAKRLTYTADFKAVKDREVVWITFDTPVSSSDESDLTSITGTIRRVARFLKDDVLIVISSQIPVGTSDAIIRMVKKMRPNLKFHYAYTPENLRLGEGMQCFLHPSRIVVGGADAEAHRRMKEIFRKIHAEYVGMSPASAEMSKHALNAFLATSISFINEIADICEDVGADVADVVRSLKSDPRIGARAALAAGLGFSGGTLGRDLVSIKNIARMKGSAVPLVQAVYENNTLRVPKLIRRLGTRLGGLRGKQIVIYGLTYKAGTTTLRRSRSLEVAAAFLKKGARLVLCDPHVPLRNIPKMKGAVVVAEPYRAAKGADAFLFLTPWKDFGSFDFARIAKQAKPGAIVLDGYNFLMEREAAIRYAGLRYYGIGR